RNFNAMVRDLAAIDPALDFPTVLSHEVAAVNLAALRATRSAKVSDLRRASAEREYITLDGKIYKVSNRFPDATWRHIKQRRQELLQTKLDARGLAKRSWLSAFGTLRVSPPGSIPSFVTNANYRGRQRD